MSTAATSSAGQPDSDVPVPDGLLVTPFQALRFQADGANLARRTSPPYDVIDDAGVSALDALDPHNVVRLILPRDEEGQPGSRYRAAAATLASWVAEGVLQQDAAPGIYVYEQGTGTHVQRGLLAAVGLTEPDAGIILPHENTMAGPVADRLALTDATAANLEPIFLVYDGSGGATQQILRSVTTTAPLADTETADGVHHRLWAITDPAQIDAVAQDLHPRRAVIADGHHRYATYRKYQAERHGNGDGTGAWDYGLAFLVDTSASGPEVHPIHRSVPGLAYGTALERARTAFDVEELPYGEEEVLDRLATAGKTGHAFVITDGTSAALLTSPRPDALAALPADRSAAWRGLDVAVAHHVLIQHVWGLDDREGVVDYYHDTPATIAAAAASGGTALLLNPTPVQAVADVAAAGDRMPRKSTLFTPKPATGMLIRPV
jgi:uncharacterized protein (DUF1015 family)